MIKLEKFLIASYIISAIISAIVISGYAFIPILYLLPIIWIIFPLIYIAPHILIYGAPIGIALTFYSGNQRKGLFFAISGIGLALIAVVPGLIGIQSTQSTVEELTREDIARPVRQLPGNIEITWPEMPHPGARTAVKTAPCEEICQKLLIGEEVDSVTVRSLSSRRNASSGGTYRISYIATYRLETRQACPATDFNRAEILPYTIWLDRRGVCIIPTVGGGRVEDAIRVSSLTTASIEGIQDARGMKVTRVEIIDPTVPENEQLRYRQTEVEIETLTIPLRVDVASGDAFKLGYEFLRSPRGSDTIDLELVLRDQLGYKLEIPDAGEPESLESEILLLLDRPGSEDISSLHDELILAYAKQLEEKTELTNDEVEILRRILNNPGFTKAYSFTRAVGNHPQIAAEFLPEILAKLATLQNPENERDAAFVWLLTKINPDQLIPVSRQIVDIIDADYTGRPSDWGEKTGVLLSIVSYLDLNPVQILERALSSLSWRTQNRVLVGFCESNEIWREELLPYLETYMTSKT